MRRAFYVITVLFLVSAAYGAVMDSESVEIAWPPENSTFIRFGFSSVPVTSIGTNPDPDDSPASYLRLNSVRRDGTTLTAYSSTPLYAYWQIYASDVYYIYISASDLRNGDASIPFTVVWEGSEGITSTPDGSGAELLHQYDTSTAVDPNSVKLTVEAVLPNGIPGSAYTGNISLELRVPG